jgi:two-component system, OmpR family, sensor histidine kinase CiaH
LLRLIWVNGFALFAGSGLSYYLSRRTLRPIEASMQAQSRFVSDASHELRTPLTAMQTASEVALRKPKLTLAEAIATLRSNNEEVAKLKTLTDGLLTLVKQEQIRGQFASVQSADVVSEAIDRIAPLAVQKHISIEDKVDRFALSAHKPGLIQLLVILLDNAVKYSNEQTQITLSATAKGNSACFVVKDQGMGIRASDQVHIFDRFYRANSARTKDSHDGYGLGLAIAQKIVEQHHGSISVDSAPGKGSIFTVKLPMTGA